jgi:hypothetical protein
MHQASPLRQVVGSVSYRSRFDRGRGSAERRHSPCARDRRAWLRVTSLAKQRGLVSASSTGGSIRAMVLRRVRHPIGRWPIGIQWGRRAHWRALLAITCSLSRHLRWPVGSRPLRRRSGGAHTHAEPAQLTHLCRPCRGLVSLRLHDDFQPGARRSLHEGVLDSFQREAVRDNG